MECDDEIAIVERAIRAVGELDIDGLFELIADDIVLDLPYRHDGGEPRLVGDVARSFFRAMPKLFSALPFHDVTIHGKLPSGTVVAEYRSDGITRAGLRYSNHYVAFFEVRAGRIAQWREFFDPTVVAASFPSR